MRPAASCFDWKTTKNAKLAHLSTPVELNLETNSLENFSWRLLTKKCFVDLIIKIACTNKWCCKFSGFYSISSSCCFRKFWKLTKRLYFLSKILTAYYFNNNLVCQCLNSNLKNRSFLDEKRKRKAKVSYFFDCFSDWNSRSNFSLLRLTHSL